MSMLIAAPCRDTPVPASRFAPVPAQCAGVHDDVVMTWQR